MRLVLRSDEDGTMMDVGAADVLADHLVCSSA